MDVRDAQEILKHLLDVIPDIGTNAYWEAIDRCTFQPTAIESADPDLGGAALLEAATEYGVNQERETTESLARELGELVSDWSWCLQSSGLWLLCFSLTPLDNAVCVYAPTQRECMEQALERLREKPNED